MSTHFVGPTGAQIVTQRLDQRQVRRHPLRVVGTTQEYVPIARAGPLGELEQKPCFADPRLAGNKHDATVSSTSLLQQTRERIQLAITANERRLLFPDHCLHPAQPAPEIGRTALVEQARP